LVKYNSTVRTRARRGRERDDAMATNNGGRKAAVPRESSLRTREMILDGAMQEFSERGFDGARIAQIALRAGVNKNLLYHHYGNKDGLFTALLEHMYARIRERQADLELRGREPVDAIRRLVVFTGRVSVQYPEFLRLIQSENLNGARHVAGSETISQMYQPLLDTLDDVLRRGREAGTFRADIDPVDLYISISALTAHYINNRHTFEVIFGQQLMTPQRVKQRLEHAADMVVAYLTRP
jgi:TetR/AcrR family transcriptional regulator